MPLLTHLDLHIDGSAADPTAPVDLLVEVPHAAWRRAHYDAVAAHLRGPFPPDLRAFFHVNTDVGAEALGLTIAKGVVERPAGRRARVLACRVPRTFVDCNRELPADDGASLRGGAMTPGLASYVTDPDDRQLLSDLHRAYQAAAHAAYRDTCGAGGLALTPHTYAPRSVEVDAIGADIVEVLRACWAEPERWPLRPAVDLITATAEQTLADPDLVTQVVQGLSTLDIPATQNDTYHLHPATSAHHHSRRHPGQVLCVEVRRDLLLEAWTPFQEQRLDAAAIDRLAGPFIDALHVALDARGR